MDSKINKTECECCTCKPCPKSLSHANLITDTHFKEFVPLIKGLNHEDIKLSVSEKTYKITGRTTSSPDENDYTIHTMDFERQFKKPISDVKMNEENGHLYVEGKFN